MTEPILDARIDALLQSLRRAEDSVKFIEEFDVWIAALVQHVQATGGNDRLIAGFDQRTRVPRDLWKKAQLSFKERIDSFERELLALRKSLAEGTDQPDADDFLKAAWSAFIDVQERSRDLFGDCLEFIGGVSFRDRHTETLWRIADELAREAAEDLFGESWSFLTVPSLDENLSDNLARTLRLRFPEWTIWNLPLLLHEFGHVAITNKDRLSKLVREQIDDLVKDEEHDDKPASRHQQRRLALARRRQAAFVRPLLADALAVYTVGPAYACAAFHLRFDPGLAAIGTPTYAERAAVVLGCLRQLDGNGHMKPLIDLLDEQWTAAVECSGVTEHSGSERFDQVEQVLLPTIVETLDDMSATPWYSSKNWLEAMMWEQTWIEQFHRGDQLQPELSPTHKLRDVLNAAWLTRMNTPQAVDALASAAPRVCASLIELKREESQQASRFARSPYNRAETDLGGLRS